MSKFFDPNKRVVHIVQSYAGAVKFANNKTEDCVKENELASPRLRRSQACTPQVFFSSKDEQVCLGSFDTNDISNADLTPATQVVVYR